MESAPKRTSAGGGSAGDRLSALPDDLLHHVLSLVLAQQDVQTTVLSKRWPGLWCSVPGIDLDINDFPDGSMEERWRKMRLVSATADRLPDVDRLILIAFGGSSFRRATNIFQFCNLSSCHLKNLELVNVSLHRSFTQTQQLRSDCPVPWKICFLSDVTISLIRV
ncbi:hypothetical protein C2845_PM16G08360 [Panicum miliaceum]|uniref:F-box domain-containing protein n=1 Tax=Panicum miliaceum TaxID=4540 RepID=A0A3L6PXD1_PANMI|nr:hypothetical protein C2845_PM16G08360 [Panicum miliaceum]